MKQIKLTFTGDIMLDSKILSINGNDYNYIFEDIQYFLKESDYVIGNLETPICEDNKDIKKEKYRFTSPLEFALAVKTSGIDLVTTANNHCLDNGIDGAKQTVELLNKIKLDNTGISLKDNEEYFIKNICGINVGFLSYTYGTNAFSNNVYLNGNEDIKINLLQEQELSIPLVRKIYNCNNIIVKIIRKISKILGLFQLKIPIYERKEKSKKRLKNLKKVINQCKQNGAEYIVMCMHAGGQYNQKPLNKVKKLAYFLQENGVDLIVGNHEHLVQESETKDDKLITYCLGDFVSCTGVLDEPFDKMSDYSVLLHIYLSENLEVIRKTFTITKTVINEIEGHKSIKVKLLYDLINECDDDNLKEKLINDNNIIISRFLNIKIDNNHIQKEYKI